MMDWVDHNKQEQEQERPVPPYTKVTAVRDFEGYCLTITAALTRSAHTQPLHTVNQCGACSHRLHSSYISLGTYYNA